MKLRLTLALAFAVALAAFPASTGAASPKIYVSLGDSLAAGYLSPSQPVTSQGYADQLLAIEKAGGASLALKKFGCPGETTATMISGGKCPYARGSQLNEAVAYVKKYAKRIAFVTIDIGANDFLACNPSDTGCTSRALNTVQTNFPEIIRQLRKAARAKKVKLRIASMTYYAPGLALWLTGPTGQAQATAYVNAFVSPLNAVMKSIYSGLRIKTADVAGAFSVTDFTTMTALPGVGTVPLNVAKLCALTSMCTRQDIHPNAQGYGVIAQEFAKVVK